MQKSNITLIGMPASGKSTIGVLLAKALSKQFVDTDLMIQSNEGKGLQAIQQQIGMEAFQALECDTVAELECENSVIAPGGSAVYCSHSMGRLKELGKVVFLDVPLADIKTRIGDLALRGVVMNQGMSLADLYDERMPLYKKSADITVDCTGLAHNEVVDAVVARLYH